MNYKKIILGVFVISMMSMISSCKKQFDNLLNNPNFPLPAAQDVDLYLNQVQLSFNNFVGNTPGNLSAPFYTASDFGMQLTRMTQWIGPLYRNGYQPNTFDIEWGTAYVSDPSFATNSGVINNADVLVPLAQSQKKYIQSGMARILEAYTMGTLVDQFGDVPFSEADKGAANTNPKVDPGAAIYAAVQTLLDSAISDLQKPDAAPGPPNDLFYNGNTDNWITLAKTLKLKFYMQTRLVDNTVTPKIQALLTENDLINTPAQDFVFKYGTAVTSPDSRHPHYSTNYVNTGVGEYICNYYMWAIAAQKYGGTVTINGGLNTTTGDPRLRYYFYRQAGNYGWANSQSCPCSVTLFAGIYPAWYGSVPDQTPYCLIGKGYLGRDHGDNSGAPPDGNFHTAWGVYPAGGQFDDDQFEVVSPGLGGGGSGINPIWLSSFTQFLEAEAALTLGITTNGSAKQLMQNGINSSISKVMSFPATVSVIPSAAHTPTTTQITNYINLVSNNYDTATTDDSRLNIIMTEYYIALWGNGVEPYNNYRRTGKPANMQPAVSVPDAGLYMRSFFYPSVFVNRNSNAPAQKDPNAANKVFWDNNPDNFIK
jgi:hypothetical protein